MTFICLVIMAAFIGGGAFDSGLVGRNWHMLMVYAALIYHVHVVVLESIYIFRNLNLIKDVNRMASDRDLAKQMAQRSSVSTG